MDDLLFDVPKNRTKLELWKERNSVWTNRADIAPDPTWIAMLHKTAVDGLKDYELEDEEKTSPFALFASYCRLIEEAGWMTEGYTEEDACFKLAQQNKLAWP